MKTSQTGILRSNVRFGAGIFGAAAGKPVRCRPAGRKIAGNAKTKAAFCLFCLAAALCGCASVPDGGTLQQGSIRGASPSETVKFSARQEDNVNPLYVETPDTQYLWESVVDVVDDFFPIPREYPIQTYKYQDENGAESVVRTEGRIDTDPVIAAGLLEPWKKNSVTLDQRLEATLQTLRRSAVLRIVPEGSGFLIHVAVYTELENLPQPMNSGTSGTNLLFNDDLTKLEMPAGESGASDGWIPVGRDFDMEQYMIRQIAWRLKNTPEVLNPDNAVPVVP